jgi:glycosyltransferase involved in cell wall biosynthesis
MIGDDLLPGAPVAAQPMRRRKFCMLTTFFPPYNFGGDGIFVYRLSNVLAQLGHSVDVIHDCDAYTMTGAQPSSAPFPLHPNVTVHGLRSETWGGRLAALELTASHQLGRPTGKHRQIAALLDAGNYDVIHFHNISLLGGPQVLAYGSSDGSSVKLCTTHDHWFVCPLHVLWRFDREPCTDRTCLACTLHGRRPPQWWRYDGTLARAVAHVDAFIAPSEFARANHLRHGFPAPMRVIPYFMPADSLAAAQAGALATDAASVDTGSQRPYFLFVGRLEKIKGLQVLIEVFRSYTTADLLVAGGGAYEAELRRQAAGLPHVRFLGSCSHAQLRHLYAGAVAAVVPSLCYETFGWITLEAFGERTPTIVHDLGPLPEIVAAGGGLAYRTSEELLAAMEMLRTDPDLRARMGEAGYRNLQENYTQARHMQRYFALIEELEAQRSR